MIAVEQIVAAVLSTAGGIAVFIYRWRRLKRAEKKKVNIAKDAPDSVRAEWANWVQKRYAKIRRKVPKGDGGE